MYLCSLRLHVFIYFYINLYYGFIQLLNPPEVKAGEEEVEERGVYF